MHARVRTVDTGRFARIIAVSDIHGSDAAFARLLARVGFCPGDALLLVGDYIERGMRRCRCSGESWTSRRAATPSCWPATATI